MAPLSFHGGFFLEKLFRCKRKKRDLTIYPRFNLRDLERVFDSYSISISRCQSRSFLFSLFVDPLCTMGRKHMKLISKNARPLARPLFHSLTHSPASYCSLCSLSPLRSLFCSHGQLFRNRANGEKAFVYEWRAFISRSLYQRWRYSLPASRNRLQLLLSIYAISFQRVNWRFEKEMMNHK